MESGRPQMVKVWWTCGVEKGAAGAGARHIDSIGRSRCSAAMGAIYQLPVFEGQFAAQHTTSVRTIGL